MLGAHALLAGLVLLAAAWRLRRAGVSVLRLWRR
jgi:hypothetical protein